MISGEKPDVKAAERSAKENKEVRTRLNNDIKTGEFSQVYLLYGEESFLLRSYKKRLKEAIIGDDDMNFTVFEGRTVDPAAVMDMADTMPFFGDRRLILLENTGWFSGAADEMTAYLDRLPETTYLLFVEETADKRLKLYKKAASMGYAARLSYQTPAELKRWIAGYAAQAGKQITVGAAELILDRVGIEMEALSREMDKYIAYVGDREAITETDVSGISVVRLEDKIFEMLDLVAAGETARAFELYADLLALREAPIKIMVLLGRQLYTLLTVRSCMDKGMGSREIASACGLNYADKYIRQARSFTYERLREKTALVVELDEAVKSGNLSDQIAVEMLLQP